MVLSNEEGSRIHGYVDDALVKKFVGALKEGESVVLDTYDLVFYTGDCKASDAPFNLKFLRTTAVKKCVGFSVDVPEKYLRTFDYIVGRKSDMSIMIDVIGQIVGVESLMDVKTKTTYH